MEITTDVVRNPKVNGVYQVSDIDLRINGNNPNSQHDVIITSIDKKRNIARVKTITSLESRHRNQYSFKNRKLDDVKNGNILLIPRNQLNSRLLSGINHKGITISLNKLHYKEPNDMTRFPKRYINLIKRK
ncbi:MAG: hypothetical protein J1F32_01795 [Erysipelotrichales bacterium]|nr:hypothetical protein [Erysipelotrichales bacterium]